MKESTFHGKRILFVCRETYSKPLWFLAKHLAKDNEVAAFFITPNECMYNKCYYNEHTYYQYTEHAPEIKMFDQRDIALTYAANYRKNPVPIDWDYVSMLEREYTHYRSLNLQLMCSQEHTKHYHNRGYWSVTSYEENIYWLELCYKRIIALIDEFHPDMLCDLDNAELQRTILTEVCYKEKIPYMTIEYSKYGYYKFPSFQNTYLIDPYIRNMYKKMLMLSDEELSESIEYIKNFREESSIMNKEYVGTVTSQYEKDSLIWVLRVMHGKWVYFWDMDITKRNLKLKRTCPILYAPSVPYFFYYLKYELVKRRLFEKNKYFEPPVPGEDYVFMPLHLIPESTVFIKGSFYVDEVNLIEQVSKSLPIGWKLYVKEHQAMLGERSLDFYKRVKELHNVRLVQVNYYRDPKPWIVNAKGVVTIVGTTAYEAALLGKKAVVFADPAFSMIDGIIRVKSFEELPAAIASFGETDNLHSAAAYIEMVKRVSTEVKIFELMDEAELLFAGKKEMTPEYEDMLNHLLTFYERGYETYLDAQKKGYFISDLPVE